MAAQVYTWDGDLMPASFLGADYNVDMTTPSLGDGEFAVVNDDGDETILFMPWALSRATDSWDTYDSNYRDPMAEVFATRAAFTIPDSYDWNATTGHNYWADAGWGAG